MNSKIKEMISVAHQALANAYAPYSKFSVSSCVLSEDGHLYTGVNVENSSTSLGICAESGAICQMVAAGQKKIKAIVVLAASEELCSPCGACRQRIFEFSDPETRVYMCNKTGILQTHTIGELLPLAFKLNPDYGKSND